jgi:hypothetical protein
MNADIQAQLQLTPTFSKISDHPGVDNVQMFATAPQNVNVAAALQNNATYGRAYTGLSGCPNTFRIKCKADTDSTTLAATLRMVSGFIACK